MWREWRHITLEWRLTISKFLLAIVATLGFFTLTHSANAASRAYSEDEVKGLIQKYSQEYNIHPDIPLAVALPESGYQWDVKNKKSGACGVFQYLPRTWRNTPEGKKGLLCTDADANVRAAVRHMAIHNDLTPWAASRSKWINNLPANVNMKGVPKNTKVVNTTTPVATVEPSTKVVVIAKKRIQCVVYARQETGISAIRGIARNIRTNSMTPVIGAVVKTSESRLGHVAVIKDMKGDWMLIREANYKSGYITERWVRINSSFIRGYIT